MWARGKSAFRETGGRARVAGPPPPRFFFRPSPFPPRPPPPPPLPLWRLGGAGAAPPPSAPAPPPAAPPPPPPPPPPPLRIRLPPPWPLPQPSLLHPPPQRFGMHIEPVIAGQVFGRQSRPEILIAGFHLRQHRCSILRCVGPVRHPTTDPMLQGLRSSRPVPCPDPFGLPITQSQQLRRFAQSQAVRLHPPHRFHPTQLFPAQSRSPQSPFLLAEGTVKGVTSNVVSWGHF